MCLRKEHANQEVTMAIIRLMSRIIFTYPNTKSTQHLKEQKCNDNGSHRQILDILLFIEEVEIKVHHNDHFDDKDDVIGSLVNKK